VFTGDAPPPNLKIPLGRASSSLVLDVRADAIRALYNQVIARTLTPKDLPSLPDLLTDEATAKALCALPAQKNQLGDDTSADERRQAACASGSKPGGANAGGISGALGDLTQSGCVLGDESAIAAMEKRLQAMDQCIEEQFGGQPSAGICDSDFCKGLVGGFSSALIILVIDKGFDVIRDNLKADSDYRNAVNRADAAGRAEINAMNAASKADERENSAERDYNIAHDKADQARLEAASAYASGDDAQIQAASEALQRAEATEKAAKETLDKAKENQQAANEKVDDAAAKAAKAQEDADAKKPEGGLEPGDAFKSPACKAALGGLTDIELRYRLGKDWANWKSGLKRVSNWNPEGASPYDSLTTPLCGGDDATIGTPQVACKVALECKISTLPDASCGCGGTPTDASRLLQTLAADACSKAHCEDPSAQARGGGIVCTCQSTVGGSAGTGRSGPVGPRPSPAVIDTLFSSSQRPSENPTVDVARTLFDGYSRR
jgi:hypothetical protein